MGAMAKKRERWHGSHGKKATMDKAALAKCHGAHGKNGQDPLKGILSGPRGGPGPGPDGSDAIFLAFLPWLPLHVSYILHIFRMTPIAIVVPFCHGSHAIFPCLDRKKGKVIQPGGNTFAS